MTLASWASSLPEYIEKAEKDLIKFKKQAFSFSKQKKEDSLKLNCLLLGGPSFQLYEDYIFKVSSLSPSGDFMKQNARGVHPVYSCSGGAHFKAATPEHPLHPLRELGVYYLQKMLVGEGIPPFFFMATQTTQGKRILLQVSESVKGSSFHEVIKHFVPDNVREPKKKIELKSLTNFLLVSFLTCPQDAKPDNFIIDDRNRIHSIDNDQNLVLDFSFSDLGSQFSFDDYDYWDSDSSSDKIKDEPNKTEKINSGIENLSMDISLRNVFYFYSHFMDQTLCPEVWERIQSLSPHAVMLEWLAILDENNVSCNTLKDKFFNSFGLKKETSHKDIPLPVPLKLRELDMKVFFERLKKLCQMKLSPENRTFQNVFSVLSPLSSLYCKRLSQQYEDPLNALKDLYQTSFSFDNCITEKDYVEDGKFLEEVIESWKQRYVDTCNNQELTPEEIGRSLFQTGSFFRQEIIWNTLTPRAKVFWKNTFYQKGPFIPWESFIELYNDSASNCPDYDIISHDINQKIYLHLEDIRKDPSFILKEESVSQEEPLSRLEREYVSNLLTNIMMGRGALDPLMLHSKRKSYLILQKPNLSGGILLDSQNYKKLLNKLDPQSTSEILLSSMIINVAFDEMENFYVQKTDDKKDTYDLIRFNHEGSISHTSGKIYSFLYFLKEMNDKVHPGCLSKIIYKDLRYADVNYKELIKRNRNFISASKSWEALKSQSRSNIDSMWVEFDQKTKFLSSRFKKTNMYSRLKDRLYRLHDFLWDYSFLNKNIFMLETSLTHADIFHFLKPDLIETYKDNLGRGYTEALWKQFCPSSRGMVLKNAAENIRGINDEIDGHDFELSDGPKKNIYKSEEKAKKTLKTHFLKKEKIQLTKIEAEKDLKLFLDNFEHIPEYQRSQILCRSDFSRINDDDLIEKFSGKLYVYKNRNLFFKKMDNAQSSFFRNINFRYLSFLTLISCPNVKVDLFAHLSKKGNNLIELVLVDLPELEHLHFDEDDNSSWFFSRFYQSTGPTSLDFPYLRSLTLLNLPKLKSVLLNAPRLYKKYFTIDEDTLSGIDEHNFSTIQEEKLSTFSSHEKMDFGSATNAFFRQYLNTKFKEENLKFSTKYLSCFSSDLLEKMINTSLDNLENISPLENMPISQSVKNYIKNWNSRKSKIAFSDDGLSFYDFYALAEVHKKSKDKYVLEQIDLSGVKEVCSQKSFPLFLNFLHKNLKDLHLNDLEFSDLQLEQVLGHIEKMTNLERLSLSRCCFPEKYIDRLSSTLQDSQKKLIFLGLSENDLGNQSLFQLKKLLNLNFLETVDLKGNCIDDEGATHFLRFLGQEKIEPTFLLKRNKISKGFLDEINGRSALSLLDRAFDQHHEYCLSFLTRIGVTKSLQEFIQNVYINPKNSYFSIPQKKLNIQSFLVFGKGLYEKAKATKKLNFKDCHFEKNTFSTLFDKFFSEISDLESISFKSSSLNFQDAVAVVDMVSRNSFLKKINLQGTSFSSENIFSIFDVMQNHEKLKKINIQNTLYEGMKNEEAFAKNLINVFENSSGLYKFFWDQNYFSDFLNKKISEKISEKKSSKLDEEHRYFESRQLFLQPKDIIDLLQDLGLTQMKISNYLGVSQSNISGIKNQYKSLTGEKLLSKIDEKKPLDFERDFLEITDFFIKRYGIKEKRYEIIKNETGSVFLLLSQPVYNPYLFLKSGLDTFKKDFMQSCADIVNLDSIQTQEDIFSKLSFTFLKKPHPYLARALGLAHLYFGPEGFSNIINAISYFEKYLDKTGAKEASFYLGTSFYELEKYQNKSHQKSFELFQDSSSENKDACYQLSKFYKYGKGCAKNPSKYLEYLEKASELGHIQASYKRGVSLWDEYHNKENGIGRKNKDKRKKSYECFMRASQLGHINSQVYVALCQRDGFGVKKNRTQALESLLKIKNYSNRFVQSHLKEFDYEKDISQTQKNLDDEFIDDQISLICKKSPQATPMVAMQNQKDLTDDILKSAQEYYLKKDFLKAIDLYQKAATAGVPIAQYILGCMYDNGQGIKKNYVEAVKWYKQAAEQGYGNAQLNLGINYYLGEGVGKNYSQAFILFKSAATKGVPDAQYNLGCMYNKGMGVRKDYTKALEWYHKAAEQSLSKAEYSLGCMYDNKSYSIKDKIESFKWYSKAAEKGFAPAQFNLAYMYYIGDGIRKSIDQALDWYKKAAQQGHVKAQYNLGVILYRQSDLDQKKYFKALKYFKKAAENGHFIAQYNLGIMFYKGKGTEKNLLEAYKWIKKSADQKYSLARYFLALLDQM